MNSYAARAAAHRAPEAGLAQSQSVASFIADSPWGRKLGRADLERVLASAKGRTFARGSAVVSAATLAHHWVGIIDGLVVQSVTHVDGYVSFLSAVSNGAWFGEGTLLKHRRWGYDAVALRETHVALIPLAIFEWLHQTNLSFNHFLQALMNDRLSVFTALLLSSRHATTEGRVATVLANFFSPAQGTRERFVRISQSELAMLAGTTRQRANDALKKLHELGVVEPHRQGVDVLDVDALKSIATVR
jgi:CRP/FNR family cyclic AMP-dependent transcriptional regulator